MAFSHGRNLALIVVSPAGVSTNISADTDAVNDFPGDIDLGDVTTAGDVGHVVYPGLQNGTFTTSHVFNDAASGSWAVLGPFQSAQQAAPTTPWTLTFGPKGTTAGFPKIIETAFVKSIKMPIKVTDPNKFTCNWQYSSVTGVTVSTF